MRTAVVVDDHHGFRSHGRRLLESAGYRILGEADDGASAFALVAASRPHVVLLDVQLPDISGFDVAIRLAEASATSDIVLVSSRKASAYGVLVERCGARGFIWKGDLTATTLTALVDHP